MARFYAEIQGNRGSASRMGTPNSGIRGHLRGWDVGVSVTGTAVGGPKLDQDEFVVYMTSGSNNTYGRTILGWVYLRDGRPYFKVNDEKQ